MSDRVKLAREIAARTEPRFIKKDAAMRLMCIFCLLFVGVVGAANATSSSNKQNGAFEYNGAKDRYDCIHHGGRWHPLTQHCTKTV